MAIVPHRVRDTGATIGTPAAPPPNVGPTWKETFGAATRLENDVYAVLDLVNKPTFDPDPEFNPRTFLTDYDQKNRSSYWQRYQDNFVGVQSAAEAEFVLSKIKQEEADRQTMNAAGPAGLIAGIAMGSLSPTMFIPFLAPGRTLKAALSAGTMMGVANAIQEIPLQMNQETRTTGESVAAIGAGVVLGGLMGGAIGALRAGEFDRIVERMVPSTYDRAIPGSRSSILGADMVQEQTLGQGGRLATGAAQKAAKVINSNRVTANPILENIEGTSPLVRERTQALGDAGLNYEANVKGVPTVAGGTAENNIAVYYRWFSESIMGSDDIYKRYVFGDSAPTVFGATRANLASRRQGKLTRAEFNEQVFDAAVSGDTHSIPEVAEAARLWRQKFYDPILQEAQAAGLPLPKLQGADLSYMMRIYDTQAIKADPVRFQRILEEHFNKKFSAEFAAERARVQEVLDRQAETIADLQRPADEVNQLQQAFTEELEALRANAPEEIVEVLDEIDQLTEELGALSTAPAEGQSPIAIRARRDEIKSTIRDLQRQAGEPLRQFNARKAQLRRRLRSLSQSKAVYDEKLQRITDKIRDIEDQAIDSLSRVAVKGRQVLNKLDRVSDEVLDKEVSRLKDMFARAGQRFDRAEERLLKAARSEDPDTQKLLLAEDQTARAGERLSEVARRLEEAEGLDRMELRTIIMNGLEITAEQVARTNLNRGKRIARLEQRAQKFTPEALQARIEGIQAQGARRLDQFDERMRQRGATYVGDDAADFTQAAKDLAEEFKDTVLGTYLRLPAFDIMQTARGPELSRGLDIDSKLIRDFLVTDPEQLARRYVQTVGADIELWRKFGTLNTGDIWRPVVEEMNNRLQRIADDPNMTADQKKRASQNLHDEYARYKRNFEGAWGRIRHTWGIPDNPEGFAHRAGVTMLTLNVMSSMGRVVITSIPELVRPIQRYGLERAFRHAVVPLITNFSQLKLDARRARQLQGGLHPLIQSRGRALYDVFDSYARGSSFERGLNKGLAMYTLANLMEPWTHMTKQFAGITANARISDDLSLIIEGGGTAKQRAKANEFIAGLGWGPEEIDRIWAQMTAPGGGERVNGIWWPNTENWTDRDAVRWYHAAMKREGDITIVTPGIDRPLWTDETLLGKLVGQFRSFALASNQRMLLAGIQQRDMALINGSLMSLALGALSYYLYGVTAGGKAYDEMMELNLGKWAEEMVDRSGLIAALSEVRRFGEYLPFVDEYMSWSGKKSTYRPADDLIDAVAGPSAGLVKKLATIITGIDDPDASTSYALRSIMPMQNVPIYSSVYDALEDWAGYRERKD